MSSPGEAVASPVFVLGVTTMFNDQGPWRALGQLGGLAFAMAVLAVLGWLIGAYLDRKLGTGPWLSLVGCLLGVAAGLFEVITVVQRAERDDSQEGRK